MRLGERSRKTEIEFGFRYAKKEVRPRIIRMASEIAYLRWKLERRTSELKQQQDRIRELELYISDLDYKIRG